MRRQQSVAGRRNSAGSYPHVVTIPVPSGGAGPGIAELDQQARRIAAGRCARWTSKGPDRLHFGFHEATHRDAFVLWLTLSGIDFG